MLSVLRKSVEYTCRDCLILGAPSAIAAIPNHGDQPGYINMLTAAVAIYDRRLGGGMYLNGAASLQLLETVSGVKQASNSNLPHVRSKVGRYLRGRPFSLRRVLLNRYENRAEYAYARLSAGLYEDMFRSASGYLLENSRWAADVAVDALQRRGFKGLFDSRDYKIVTAISTLYDRLAHGTAVTVRARRFWRRDVGQMIRSSADLYDMIELPRADMYSYDGLDNFAERSDKQNLAAAHPPDLPFFSPWSAMRARLDQSASTTPFVPEWAKATAVIGVAITSAHSDKPVDRSVKKHQNSKSFRNRGKLGKAMPVVPGCAEGAAFALVGDRIQNDGLISMQSVVAATGLALVGKYAIGRARPVEEHSSWSSVGEGKKRCDASFPSAHATIAFPAVTSLTRKYDAPLLYSVAALDSVDLFACRKVWVSDTVAVGTLGYTVRSWPWHAQRDQSKSGRSINAGFKEVNVTWQTTY